MFGSVPDGSPLGFLGSPDRFLYVAEEGGSVVGWLYGYELVRPDGDRMMLLYAVDVDAAHRLRGHGAALVEALRREAVDRGHAKMWVLCDPDEEAANALYRATGGSDAGTQRLYSWS